MAARRGLHYPEGENVDIVEVLPPGARQAYDDYLALRKDREGMGGEFVFDAEQHADRATCGPFFSSFLTHLRKGHLTHLRKGQFLKITWIPCTFVLSSACLSTGLRNLSAYQQKFLAGQAVHTHVMGARVTCARVTCINCEHDERCGRRR